MVIIVGFVMLAVVTLAAILFFKYVTRLSYDWHEQRVEEAMTRAINIYNSQEPLEEPHLVYIRPGGWLLCVCVKKMGAMAMLRN